MLFGVKRYIFLKEKFMPRMSDSDTPKVTFKIENDRPEDSPNSLAIQMAECMQNSSQFQTDGEVYKTAASAELQKAKQLQNVIFQIKERQKNPPAKVSRMDPLAHYDLEDCETQLANFKERAVDMQSMADDYFQKADANKNESNKLQIRIREENKKSKRKG